MLYFGKVVKFLGFNVEIEISTGGDSVTAENYRSDFCINKCLKMRDLNRINLLNKVDVS